MIITVNQSPLEEAAQKLGLSREYFCRFFKQSLGVTFTRYVNQIRLIHIYHDICNTEDGIMEIVEATRFYELQTVQQDVQRSLRMYTAGDPA